ncbi:hypothetical protein F4861DRAFT_543335 [Xylaria intraflava]|nr:hypothetical protein F4861DRAFT_543335 [Xylaria intraflava]
MSVKIEDLDPTREASPSDTRPSHAPLTTRATQRSSTLPNIAANRARQPTTIGNPRLGRTHRRPKPTVPPGLIALRRFNAAYHSAGQELTESIESIPRPVRHELVNRVGIRIYVAEEHPEMVGRRTIARVEKLRCHATISPRPVPIMTVFASAEELVAFIKRHWIIPSPFAEADCRIIGGIAGGRPRMPLEFSFKPDTPIRLFDIKPSLVGRIDATRVRTFHISLYFPLVFDGHQD